MSDRVDISLLITELCVRLDLGPKENVGEVVLCPGEVTATVYRLNENGAKYIDVDTNQPATDTRTIKVFT